ncbi:hypothetical protein [Streptomyces sp. NPDC051132]|uniref:hypothetical protein n=1 Tax=unclassified Streptomyces TaxID=2593676 RepID=UPI003420C8E2
MITKALRKAAASGVCALVAASAVAVAAPEASAATSVHCSGGNTVALVASLPPAPTVITSRSACPGYTDTGSPYTFDFDVIGVLTPEPLGQPRIVPWFNVRATCGSISEDNTGKLTLGSCTYSTL